jgi:hypothetical protein
MVRVTDFGRPKRTYDKDDVPRPSLPLLNSTHKSQRSSQKADAETRGLKRKRGTERECFVCHKADHLSHDCPQRSKIPLKNRSGSCYRCGKTDHIQKDCKASPSNKGYLAEQQSHKNLSRIKCHQCQKSGHIASACPENGNGDNDSPSQPLGHKSCQICGIGFPQYWR